MSGMAQRQKEENRVNFMNKNALTILLTTVALASMSQFVSAHEQDEDSQPVYQQERSPRFDGGPVNEHQGGGRLSYEVDHLRGMMGHVERELRRYRADRHIWSEYQHLRGEFRQLDYQFRRGEQYYNRRRLHAQIEHMHGELHHIEQELHVRASEWYQWR
jgi:hypothetical protein